MAEPAKQPQHAGQVPLTEEMDSAKWTLPPVVPVLIGLALVAAVVGLVLWQGKPKPGASGSVTRVAAAQQTDNESVLVAVNVRIDNIHERPFWVKRSSVQLKTDQGEWSDDAASVVDFERYFQGYPDLRSEVPPLKPEMRIEPGGRAEGMVIVAFPITKEQFEARKELAVTIDAYDRTPLVLKEGGK